MLPIFQIYKLWQNPLLWKNSHVLIFIQLRKGVSNSISVQDVGKMVTQIFSSNSVLTSSKKYLILVSLIYNIQLKRNELGDMGKIPSLYFTLHYSLSGLLLLTIFRDLPDLKILKFHITPQNKCTLKQRAR